MSDRLTGAVGGVRRVRVMQESAFPVTEKRRWENHTQRSNAKGKGPLRHSLLEGKEKCCVREMHNALGGMQGLLSGNLKVLSLLCLLRA